MRRWLCRSENETRSLGRALAGELLPDRSLLVEGELGAGKTVLARGVAEGLEIEPAEGQSPTFTLVREHQGLGGRLFHLDLYRLEAGQVEEIGLDEVLAGPGIKVVEWPERLRRPPVGALRVRIVVGPFGVREIAELDGGTEVSQPEE